MITTRPNRGLESPHHRQTACRYDCDFGQKYAKIPPFPQADCYVGVWGYHAQKDGLFEQGDVEEAFAAAEAVGDDTLQHRAQGYTVPHTYTHGTSAQRK